ncbi:MAG: carbohydrate-binding domain-containing protein [Burkholderiales bacterium]|jgi:hypothetical protein|nr:carbohydrate-binding domain-containing protein [Burkholderiales bacterium]
MRSLFHLLSGVVLALVFSFPAPVGAQETIAYPDDFPPLTLQTVDSAADSLAPAGSSDGKSVSLSGNSITVNSGASVSGRVYGAINLNDSEIVSDNRVLINGVVVGRAAYGGYHYFATGNIATVGNIVTVSNGTVNDVYGGEVVIPSGTGTSADNNVTINDGTVNWSIRGGAAWSNFGAVTATGNSVTINSGTVYGDVCGGVAWSTFVTAIASGNSVTINGGTVNGNVSGGEAIGIGTAANNTVTIRGAPTFGADTVLYGGRLPSGGVSTGNTLNLHSANLTVGEVDSFQRLNFYLPATLTSGGTMLTIVGSPGITSGAVNITGVAVSVALDGTGFSLRTGDRFILIDARELRGNFQPTSGVLGGYACTVTKEGNQLVLVIGDLQSGPTREYTGQWHKVDEDAWGLSVLQNFPGQPRYIFVPWFTYDRSGNAAWYIFQGDDWSGVDTISADVYRYTGPTWGVTPYDNDRVTNTKVGTAKLTFTSATTARFEYDVDGSSRAIDLRKLE